MIFRLVYFSKSFLGVRNVFRFLGAAPVPLFSFSFTPHFLLFTRFSLFAFILCYCFCFFFFFHYTRHKQTKRTNKISSAFANARTFSTQVENHIILFYETKRNGMNVWMKSIVSHKTHCAFSHIWFLHCLIVSIHILWEHEIDR